MGDPNSVEKERKGLIHIKNFYDEILDVQKRYGRELTITHEDSHNEYTTYIFAFDFGVDKFESFIILHWDIEEFDETELISEIDTITIKAERLRDN